MPQTEAIFTEETFYFRIPNVKLNDSAVTDAANIPDSFTYEGLDEHGAALSPTISGSMTYNATALINGVTTPCWEAIITAPTASRKCHLHGVVTKGTNVGFFHDIVNISSRQ